MIFSKASSWYSRNLQIKTLLLFGVLMFFHFKVSAQIKPKKPIQTDEINFDPNSSSTNNSVQPQTNTSNSAPRKDTIGFEHRNDAKDSIRLSYRYLGDVKKFYLDSGINDFDKYFSVPTSSNFLGNNGAAVQSLIFKDRTNIGFDPGFHAFDLYLFTAEKTKYYTSTKPFTALSYQLASGKEQMLKIHHTQNPNTTLNLNFDFNMISAPGLFATQNNNHNSYSISGHYLAKKKRYGFYFGLLGNNIKASQNGGIVSANDLSDPNRKDRFSVPVVLGNQAPYLNNPFSTSITTGLTQKEQQFFLQQHYDIGKKDSVIINDSTTEYLFYPKLRIQHRFSYQKLSYGFRDYFADSTVYKDRFNQALPQVLDSFTLAEQWTNLQNELSLINFPDTKNTSQFIMAGVVWQTVFGTLKNGNTTFNNLVLNGAYRNLTRNKKWDLMTQTSFYVLGENAGDYKVQASIQRKLNRTWGDVGVYFSNVNRSPARLFQNQSVFNLDTLPHNFSKENTTILGLKSQSKYFDISFQNFTLLNFIYYKNYTQPVQYKLPINIIQFIASKKVNITKHWNWYTTIALQQTDGAAPIKLPLVFTRNRVAYEGKFFRNLQLSTGLEMRYYTPFKANDFSPLIGQFVFQDAVVIKNRPDVSAFFHFRIRGFAGYLRAENLNTLDPSNAFSFTKNNFSAPLYPTPGLMIRFGIQWWFVN